MATGLFDSIAEKYRNAVDMRKRVYGESLLKSFTGNTDKPINNSDFTSSELVNLDNLIKQHYQQKIAYFTRPKEELLQDAAQLEKNAQDDIRRSNREEKHGLTLITPERYQNRARLQLTQAQQLKEAAQGKLPTDFMFEYTGYGERNDRNGVNSFSNDPSGWAQTLGRFRYKINPTTGEYQAYDAYDFNNEVHRYQAENYSEMSPPVRMGSALTNTFIGDPYALGEAYLTGSKSVPIDIKRKIEVSNKQITSNPTYSDPFANTIGSSIR